MDALEAALRKQLTLDEGKSQYAYRDNTPQRYDTIAIGRLCDSRVPGSGLSEEEIQFLFGNDNAKVLRQVDEYMPWLNQLDEARKGALMNMVFQMGVGGVLKFTNSLQLLRAKRYDEAAVNFAQSKWATIDTPNRARRIIRQIKTGIWQFA